MTSSRSKAISHFLKNSSSLRLLAAGGILVVQLSHATACDVCLRLPRVPFEAEHPAAIEVAMATQAAVQLGELDLNPLVNEVLTTGRHLPPRLDEISPKQLATLWSRARPARNNVTLRLTLEIIFVDVDRACRFDIRFGEVIEGDPRSCPADVRLITTKAGFHRLLEDGFKNCEERNLIAVEADDDKYRNELIQLFSSRNMSSMRM